VDRAVVGIKKARGPDVPFDRESKKRILEALLARFDSDGESRTLFGWISQVASSLAAVIDGGAAKLQIPRI